MELSTLWPDTVKRGPMIRDVRGLGTLVPEDTMLITAVTDARIERILVKPGTPVRADTVVMIMTSPELETALLDAEYALKAAEADYKNLEVTLQKTLLDLQSAAAQTSADYNTAKLEADRDTALAKENLLAGTDAKISQVKAEQLAAKYEIEKKRLAINDAAEQAQLAAQKVKVDQLRGEYELKKSQVDQLKVRAGFDGMLQAVPPPLDPGGRRPEGAGRNAAGQGGPAQPSEGRAEDRRNADQGCRHRAAGRHRYAPGGRRLQRPDRGPRVAHRSVHRERHRDRGCGAEGPAALGRRGPI